MEPLSSTFQCVPHLLLKSPRGCSLPHQLGPNIQSWLGLPNPNPLAMTLGGPACCTNKTAGQLDATQSQPEPATTITGCNPQHGPLTLGHSASGRLRWAALTGPLSSPTQHDLLRPLPSSPSAHVVAGVCGAVGPGTKTKTPGLQLEAGGRRCD